MEASPLRKFVSHPVVTLISLLIGVVGLFLAYSSREIIQLRVSDSKSHPMVVDTSVSQDLEVQWKGTKVAEPVYLASFAIWNGGTRAIAREDVLKPVQVVFPEGTKVLTCSIQQLTRDVIGASVLVEKNSDVVADFSILEPSDGFVVNILYAASKQQVVTIRGVVRGQPRIYRGAIGRLDWIGIAGLGAICLLGSLFLLKIGRSAVGTAAARRDLDVIDALAWLCAFIFLTGFGGYLVWMSMISWSYVGRSPFGF
jgi:hypothetical protein